MIFIDQLQKNDLIDHPKGGKSFGVIPEILHVGIQAGDVYLRKGDHWLARSGYTGFGAVHIWSVHEYELRKMGYLIIEDVADYVAKIIQPGTEIYFESNKNPKKRLTVLRSHFGILALEPRNDRDTGFGYQVVSAYPTRQARGTLVGTTK
nr:hypothetical protein [Pseudomonas oleovorans]